MRQEEGAYSRWKRGWFFDMLAEGVGAYPREDAHQNVGSYSRKYDRCSSETSYFPDDLRRLCFQETTEKCGS